MDLIIRSKGQLKKFIAADMVSLGNEKDSKFTIFDEIAIFQKRLRKLEYSINCQRSAPVLILRKYLFRKSSIRLGFSISPNTFGPGLSIAHRGTIIVNGGARIGSNCRIHADVNIGTQAGRSSAAPIIGDNCYIGPGAKIFGEVIIGSGVVIGANAVVNKSFPEPNQTLAGIPARKVSDKSSHGLLIEGYKKDD
jgi:serine O-acetyltransferase